MKRLSYSRNRRHMLISTVLAAVLILLGLPSCKSKKIGRIIGLYGGPDINYYRNQEKASQRQMQTDSTALQQQPPTASPPNTQ